ncbi:hypothetical protein SEA_FRANCOB_64 [Streptomyces phage Francob]
MKFSDFVAQSQEAEKPQGTPVDGGFSCMTCYEQVDEAEYFRVEKILKWKCSEGHVSYVEEFIL